MGTKYTNYKDTILNFLNLWEEAIAPPLKYATVSYYRYPRWRPVEPITVADSG